MKDKTLYILLHTHIPCKLLFLLAELVLKLNQPNVKIPGLNSSAFPPHGTILSRNSIDMALQYPLNILIESKSVSNFIPLTPAADMLAKFGNWTDHKSDTEPLIL